MDTVKMTPPMPDEPKCPQCGTPLPTGALAGLCPACLLKMGASETVTDAKQSSFTPPSVAELALKFPQLEMLELIGKGGMGAVYKARQRQLDRIVALKILPPGIGDDPAFAERFAREAKALAKLNHPGIVTIYDFGRADGLFYFFMEFVDGVNLRQLLAGGRISPREALAIVPQICDALQFAHDQGIVHRDIKPENILLDRRGRVKVADFGLAKIIATDAPLTPSLSPSDGERVAKAGEGSTILTDAGKTMGTPQYMSPEQIQAPGEVDHRADIYALGVVFYQMLTGELPGKKIQPPSTKVQIDVRLDEIVLRALEKNPELRYQQVSEVKTCVETIASTADAVGSTASDFISDPPAGAPDASKMVRQIVGWGLALAIGGIQMSLHTSPLMFSLGIGIWTVLAFLISTSLALFSGGSLTRLKAACLLVSIDGIVVASAAMWCAHTAHPPLNKPWLEVIIVACISGIIYCLVKMVKLINLTATDSHPMPALKSWLALMDKGDYAQSWEAGSRSFRWIVTKGDWMEALEKVRRPLGKIIFRKLVSTNYSALGNRFEAKFDSSFDGLKSTAETLVFTRQWNGAWKPAGYLIGHTARQSQSLRRLKKFFFFTVPVAILFTLIVRAYFLQPFHVAGGGVEPEIPVGSRILVWKFHLHPAPGDLIAHWHNYQVWVSRVVSADDAGVIINRNGQPDETIPNATVLGKVVTVYWRASNGSGIATGFSIGQSYFPGGDSIEITRIVRSEKRLMAKGHYNLVSHDQATLALYITTATNSPYLADTRQTTNIPKGRGDFELVHTHPVPGLPHVSMRADGHPFADIYFGNKAEAAEENKLDLSHSTSSGEPFVFGPAMERAVPDNGVIDFDTGKTSFLPEGMNQKSPIGEWGEWMEKNGMDAHCWKGELTGFGGEHGNYVLRSAALVSGIADWDSVTPTQLMQALHSADTPGGGMMRMGTSVIYGFKTREGGMVLLQMTGQDPRGVKIRYKLVQTFSQKTSAAPSTLPAANHRRELGLLSAWMELRLFQSDQYWNLTANTNPNCQLFKPVFPGASRAAVLLCLDPSGDLQVSWSRDKKLSGDLLQASETEMNNLRKDIREFYQIVRADAPLPFTPIKRVSAKATPAREDYTNAIALIDLAASQLMANYIGLKQRDVKLAQNTEPAFVAEMHNFNELMRGTTNQIPGLKDLDKAVAALKAGDMEKAEALNEAADKNAGKKSTDLNELKERLRQEIKSMDQNNSAPVEGGQVFAKQPPVVVATFPVSGARDVRPGIMDIRVRFSKPMRDDSWSWSTAWENSTPEFIGTPHYEADGKTCVAKVKLEPGKTYAFWLNSERFLNFKDDENRPAIPYLLIFQTKQK